MDKVYVCRLSVNLPPVKCKNLLDGALCSFDNMPCDCQECVPLKGIQEIAKEARDKNLMVETSETGYRQTKVAIDYGTWKKLIEYAKED